MSSDPSVPRLAARRAARGAERLHGAIARDLGVAITSGRHRPGDILSNEIEFSERLNVSRSAYREAVRILSAKGLVESRPRVGTRVTPMARWNLLDPDVLAWFFAAEPPPAVVEGLFELRMIIEPAAAALAARRRSVAQLEQMRQALETMGHLTVQSDAGQEADLAFHRTILEATGNPPLISLASTIGAGVRWTTIYKGRKLRAPPDPMPAHRAVFAAIADADPAAAQAAMAALVTEALSHTAEALEAPAPLSPRP